MKIIAEFSSVEEIKEFTDMFSKDIEHKEIEVEVPKVEEPKKKTKKKIEEPKVEEPKTEAVDFSKVREFAVDLTKAGKGEEIKKIVKEFGASKLTDLKEEDYIEIVKKFEGLK